MSFDEQYKVIEDKFMENNTAVSRNYTAQFHITGKDGGDIFFSYMNGHKFIEPVRHNGADINITMTSDTFEEFMSGRLDGFKAFTTGKIKATGNVMLALSIYNSLR